MTWDGRYRLERTLGEGGMGRVLLARDLAADEHVMALKILLPEYRHSTAGFLREFVTQRSFRHPNIPQVYEFGFAQHPRGGEVPYFTLEYCRGVPLVLAIPRLKDLEPAWTWMIQMLRALDYIHRMGWLHRDIKPGNLLVDLDPEQSVTTRLIDLGVASRLGDPPDEVFIGTPEYCSPEMLAGTEFDQRADLYAFGLVLYEVLEKRRPWPGSDEDELMRARLDSPPPPILNPACPAGVKTLIKALLAPKAADRPFSAAEVLEAFCKAVGRDAPIETSHIFLRRLESIPFPGREEVVRTGEQSVLDLTSTGGRADARRVLVVESPRGFDGAWVAHELADRACIHGARVLRLSLDVPAETPLGALQPAIDVFRRLREDATGREIPAALHSTAAGAAAMLTRLHGPTVIVIEELQRADEQSLGVLLQAFVGSATPNLRVVATVDPEEAPVARAAFGAFMAAPYVHRVPLPGLTLETTARWMDQVVGRGVLEVPLMSRLHGAASGRPAALVAAVHDLFRQGVLRREVDGYVVEGDADRALAPAAATDVSEVDGLLACIRHPLPEEVVVAYLGEHAKRLHRLVAKGLLVRRPDGMLAVADERWRRAVYRTLPAVDKMHRHRKLARAIHAADRFARQRRLVASELMHSDRPVLAAPHLVVAAAGTVGAESATRAGRYLDRAEELLRAHAAGERSGDAWRWWVMLWKARVRLAMASGDLGALDTATQALLELATDAAHLPTLRFALETRMVAAFERGDWRGLVQHAASRLTLDGEQPGADARGLHLWAEALRLRAFGETGKALELLAEGLDLEPERPRAGVLVRLAAARAEILIQIESVREAVPALEIYRHAADAAGAPAQALRARILAASLQRLAGRPEQALRKLRDLTHELPGDHVRRASSLLELELARAHLEFGWGESCRDHAEQARVLAERDDDAPTAAQAMLVRAASWRLTGQAQAALATCEEVLETLEPLGDWPPLADAQLLRLRLLLEGAVKADPGGVAEEARAVAEQAGRRLEYPRAARALSIAAEAALAARQPLVALNLAERALSAADRRPGWEAETHRLLYVLARARRASGRQHQAEALEQRALEHLRRVASAIASEQHRRSWLSVRDHVDILGLAAGQLKG